MTHGFLSRFPEFGDLAKGQAFQQPDDDILLTRRELPGIELLLHDGTVLVGDYLGIGCRSGQGARELCSSCPRRSPKRSSLSEVLVDANMANIDGAQDEPGQIVSH